MNNIEFYQYQSKEYKTKYHNYLELTCSLSKLFSDSSSPYLYYRVAENIFCLSFEAVNLSRSDVSIDAKKGNIGFGLKTFLYGNGKTLQKIAEFNALREEYIYKKDEEIVNFISNARNERLDLVINSYKLENLIYHCVIRKKNELSIYEFPMSKIDIDNICDIKRISNTIQFNDKINEYSFNLSKSTLYKRFNCTDSLKDIKVDILENPFEVLTNLNLTQSSILKEVSSYPFIYLPLYAPSSKDLEPGISSGINQWNAGGRDRHEDELYIPVPSWIHQKFKGFFPDNNDDKFELELPDSTVLNAKMCQAGQKGLMSNPNKALGKWILRDVLKIPPRTLIDRSYLNKIGIDSVIIIKIDENKYKIDFASLGKYENFKNDSISEEENTTKEEIINHDTKEFYIENKKDFERNNSFRKDTVKKVFDFAYEMSYGTGEHRNGGELNRKNGEIFINTFQGKLAELAVYNEIYKLSNDVYKKLSIPDFNIFGLGKWDDVDISLGDLKFAIKSTKFYGNLLLLETKDWDRNGQYIPNVKINKSHYDYIVLVRIAEDGTNIMRLNGLLYGNEVNREHLYELISSEVWFYDIPGYISNEDLVHIIKKKQIIPRGYKLNGKISMDTDKYYEETGKLKDFFELVKSLNKLF